jgi:hypothetical protein
MMDFNPEFNFDVPGGDDSIAHPWSFKGMRRSLETAHMHIPSNITYNCVPYIMYRVQFFHMLLLPPRLAITQTGIILAVSLTSAEKTSASPDLLDSLNEHRIGKQF